MTVAQELEFAERTILLLDALNDVEAFEPAVKSNQRAHRRLQDARRESLRALSPVRISTAAAILGVSEPTARLWTDGGLLEEVAKRPVRRVSPDSVLRILPIVRDLKRQGRNRNLLDAIFNRLDDEAQLADPGLLESLEQMRRGDTIDITPR